MTITSRVYKLCTRKVNPGRFLARSHASWIPLKPITMCLHSLEYFSILHWRYASSEAHRPDYSCMHSIWFGYKH